MKRCDRIVSCVLFSLLLLSISGRAQEWSQRTIPGGAADIISWNPHDSTHVIGFDVQNDIAFQSSNGGLDWEISTDGLPDAPYYNVSIWYHPTDPDYQYFIASDRFLLTTDGGDSWESRHPMTPGNIYFFDICRSAPENIICFAVNGGVSSYQLSTNAGESWSDIDIPDLFFDVHFDPFDPTHLYAYGEGQLKHSTDSGVTWNNLLAPDCYFNTGWYFETFSPDPVRSGTLWVVWSDGIDFQYLVRVTDDSPDMEDVVTPADYFKIDHAGNLIASNYFDLMSGNVDCRVSSDGGDTWNQVGTWMPYSGHWDGNPFRDFTVTINPLNPSTIFLNNGSNLFLSWHDGLEADTLAQGLGNANIGNIYPLDDGMLVRTVNGQVWRLENETESGWPSLFNFVADVSIGGEDNTTVYASGMGIDRSDDGGYQFEPVFETENALSSPSVLAFPGNATTALAWIGRYLFLTNNSGVDWIQLEETGLPSSWSQGDLYLNPFDPSVLWTWNEGLYKSIDGGLHWTGSASITDQIVQIQAIPGSNDLFLLDAYGDIHRYLSDIDDIQPLELPEEMQPVLSIDLRPGTNSHLLATTPDAVYESRDNGNHWTRIEGEYSGQLNFACFTLDGSGVMIGTRENGIWIGDELFDTSVGENPTEIPAHITLHPAYPNPFNAATRIAYELPTAARVKVTVFDVLGREVTELVDGIQVAGLHQLQWNAEGRSSGTYMIQLNVGETIQSQKVQLVK